MKKILVTGGLGFIGAHLVENLIKNKNKVLVFDNCSSVGGILYKNPKCEFIKGDLVNSNDLKKIKNWKPQIIYHLAAQSGSESAYLDKKKDFLTNGFGTLNLCVLAKQLKVEKFIYTSSVAVYGSNQKKIINERSPINPNSIYGVSKFAGELFIKQVLKKTSVKTIIFRVFNTYGPGENINYFKKGMVSIFCGYIWKKKPIIVKGSLNRVRDITYIDDVIKVLIRAKDNKLVKKDEIINLSSGKSFKIKKLVKEIIKASGKKKYRVIVSGSTPGDSKFFHTSNLKLKKFFPKIKFTPINIGLKKYFDWIKQVPNKKNIKDYHPLKIVKKL